MTIFEIVLCKLAMDCTENYYSQVKDLNFLHFYIEIEINRKTIQLYNTIIKYYKIIFFVIYLQLQISHFQNISR